MYIIKLTLFSNFYSDISISIIYLHNYSLSLAQDYRTDDIAMSTAGSLFRIFRVTIEQADKINISDMKDKGIILIPNHVCVTRYLSYGCPL